MKLIAYISILFLFSACFNISDPVDENCETRSFNPGKGLEYMSEIPFYTDIDNAIDCAQKSNKPIFILFTGFACMSSTEIPYRIFKSDSIRESIRDNFIAVALFVDDKRDLPKNEFDTVVIQGKERIISTVGQKNSMIQIENFRNNSQPLYVCTDHNLNQLIKMDYETTRNPDDFLEKLQRAIKIYKTLPKNT